MADALIEVKASVRSKDARKLYPEFPALAMILLSRANGDRTADLLSILEQAKAREVWLAAANMLAENPTPEFVAKLMTET